jgi:type II secretory pathway component PulF
MSTIAARPMTLDQLAALSDELAALARAGVPLDRGLRELAHDMPGRLGKMAAHISQRLEAGQPLEQIVAELGLTLPPAYRAVVVAGARAGRLSAALEGISHTARRIGQLRSSIYLSLVYPLVVLVLVWVLGLAVMIRVAPVMAAMLIEFDAGGPHIVALLQAIGRNAFWIGPSLPLLFAAWMIWAWIRSGQIAAGTDLHPLLAAGAVGTLARMQRASRLASLADMLSLLLNHSVPLDEAVELASAAVGSRAAARGGSQLAEQLRRGELIRDVPAGFPPLLAWTIASGQSQRELVRSLARTAETYRDEVFRRGQWLSMYVPLIATLLLCGGAVFAYAVLTLGPWILIMRRLSLPV